MYRTVACTTWDDPWFAEDLPADGKLLFIYLITNSHASAAGAYELTARQMAFETGLPQERVEALLSGPLTARVTWWPQLRVVWVHNFYRRQRAQSNPHYATAARRVVAELPPVVQAAVAAYYPELAGDATPVPPVPVTNGRHIPMVSHRDGMGKGSVSQGDNESVTVTESVTVDSTPLPPTATVAPMPAPIGAKPPKPAKIKPLQPVPKAGFDYPGLWAACETALGYRPTWNYAVETKAVNRLLTAYPGAQPADFARFLAYVGTCWPWCEEPTRPPTFSQGGQHFAAWYTQGQPATAPQKGDRQSAAPDKLTQKLRNIRASVEADYRAEWADDGSQNGDSGPAYEHVPRLLPSPVAGRRGA